jgi:hypothetical protein
VTAFVTGIQFGLDAVKHRVLCLDETLQIKGVQRIGTSHADVL